MAPNSSIIIDKRATVRGSVSFRRNPNAQSPRSNSNRRQSADVVNRRQSNDVSNPVDRLTNRRRSDTAALMSGWRSVDCIGLYQSALSRKSPEEERPKTVQIVQVCAVKKRAQSININ